MQEGGLAHPRSGEKHGKSQVRLDRLNHRLRGSKVHPGGEEKRWIRRNSKWRLAKSKVPEKVLALIPGALEPRNRYWSAFWAVVCGNRKHYRAHCARKSNF